MSEEAADPPREEETTTADAGEAGGEDDVPPKEEESTAHFEPLVNLEEVDVKTGEEEEEKLYEVRGKLFVHGESLLNLNTGERTWNERGVGLVKFLRHREHQRIRLLMRQEKTMKVILNHLLDSRLRLEPNVGSDKSWVWSAFDFADGALTDTVFALRFSNADVAAEFKDKFETHQKEMEKLLAGEDKPGEDGGAQADEAAAALATLTTDDKE